MLPEAFLERMKHQLGEEYEDFLRSLERPRAVALRYNPLKGQAPSLPFVGDPVPWEPEGFYYDPDSRPGLHVYHEAGVYYLQEASAMAPVALLDPQPGEKICDLCSAPGGKPTQIAGRMLGKGFLLCNEWSPKRAKILSQNIERMGVANALVTNEDTSVLAKRFAGSFDKVLIDAPCSGEGMFRKDEEAQRQWSEDNVALCEARQRRITADVWPSLRQDGLFIYSTCTFNKYENDSNVQWIASELGAECLLEDDLLHAGEGVIKTALGYSLVPGHVEGEGQYCSALRKISEVEFRETRLKAARPSKTQTLPEGIVAGLLRVKAVVRLKGETVIAVPENISSDLALIEQALHVISAGCAVGTLKGKVLVPDADLALSLMYDRTAFPEAEVDRDTALAYLHRDAITLPDAPKGYVAVVYGGLPLGFVKNLGNRCNSLHPQSRRIRMNIK